MDRPFVYVNMAMTADGKITSALREYPRLTSDFDRRTMDRLRAEADALLIGGGTLRADDPPVHVRHPDMRDYRRSLGKPEGLLNVVMTASADLDPASAFFTAGPAAGRIVATTENVPADREEQLSAVAEVWKIGRDRVDVPGLLARLRERGVDRLLLEGGGELNWSFAREDLVDEFYITLAPALLGGREAPTLLEGEGFAMAEQRRLLLADVLREGDEIFCRYVVERP